VTPSASSRTAVVCGLAVRSDPVRDRPAHARERRRIVCVADPEGNLVGVAGTA
jgi:hypothetical protein